MECAGTVHEKKGVHGQCEGGSHLASNGYTVRHKMYSTTFQGRNVASEYMPHFFMVRKDVLNWCTQALQPNQIKFKINPF